MAETEIKPEATPVRSCLLEAAEDGVRILVDGCVAQVMPFDAYESLRKGLSASEQLNVFPLEISGQTALKLQLPPVAEVKAGRVALQSRDGVTYGRRYKVVSVAREADGATRVTIAAADTGEVVEREAWDDFKARVKAGECRSATPYAVMLGEFNGRLYYTVTGVIYQPPEGEPKPEAAAGVSGAEGVEPEAAAEETPPTRTRALWAWMQKNPRVACTGIVLLGLLVGFGIRVIVQRVRARIPTIVVSNPKSVEQFLELNFERAKALDTGGFEDYARKYPKVVKDNIEKLKSFLDKTREVTLDSSEQVAKLQYIRDAVPRLEAQLAKANRP